MIVIQIHGENNTDHINSQSMQRIIIDYESTETLFTINTAQTHTIIFILTH